MLKDILKDGIPTPERDPIAWARWFETADRRVALTRVGEYTVSTVFLGLDHSAPFLLLGVGWYKWATWARPTFSPWTSSRWGRRPGVHPAGGHAPEGRGEPEPALEEVARAADRPGGLRRQEERDS